MKLHFCQGYFFFNLQRWIAKLPLPKFKGSHLSGLAGQPWDCFNFFLYLFDCGEVFWRKMWLRKIRDRNPHGEKKMEKRCWAHSGQRFLAVGFGSRWVFSQSLFGNSPTPHEKWPQDETLHSNPNCWEIYQKKLIQLSPCFLPLIFFTTNLPFLDSSSHRTHESPPRDMHQDISPAVFGYNDWSNRCRNINLEASQVNPTPSGCFS